MLSSQVSNENIRYLRSLIDVCSNIVSGPQTFIFSAENGFSFESMEPSGAVFVYFNVPKEFFTLFECKKDILELRINIEDLKKVLSRNLTSEEQLSFTYSESSKFTINFVKEKGQKRKYELSLHNPQDDDSQRNLVDRVKSIPLNCTAIMNPGTFKDILADVGIAADKKDKPISVSVTSKMLKFEMNRGMDGMTATVELPESELASKIVLENDESFETVYDMDYLEKLTKIDAIASKVIFEFGIEKPLRMAFNISDKMEFIFMAGPLQSDDDFEDSDDDDDSTDD